MSRLFYQDQDHLFVLEESRDQDPKSPDYISGRTYTLGDKGWSATVDEPFPLVVVSV